MPKKSIVTYDEKAMTEEWVALMHSLEDPNISPEEKMEAFDKYIKMVYTNARDIQNTIVSLLDNKINISVYLALSNIIVAGLRQLSPFLSSPDLLSQTVRHNIKYTAEQLLGIVGKVEQKIGQGEAGNA